MKLIFPLIIVLAIIILIGFIFDKIMKYRELNKSITKSLEIKENAKDLVKLILLDKELAEEVKLELNKK
jgi:hypothetical protein